MLWKIKLKTKTVPAYKSPDSIKVCQHIKYDKSILDATEYYSDKYRSRYFLSSKEVWVDASQVLVIEEMAEEIKEKDPYEIDELEVFVKNDIRLYQYNGVTINIVSDSAYKLTAGTTVRVDGSFTQHRTGIENYYRIANGEFKGYWIRIGKDISVITSFDTEPKSDPVTQSRPHKMQRVTMNLRNAPEENTPVLYADEDGDGVEDSEETTDPDRSEDGITIGAFWTEESAEESSNFDVYEAFTSSSIGHNLEQLADAASDRLSGTFFGNVVNTLRDVYNTFISSESELSAGTSFTGVPIYRYSFVHGLPFQFTPITDRRYYADTTDWDDDDDNADQYGRSFAKTIVADTPVVVFTPGLPRYLTSESLGISASAEEQNSLLNLVAGGEADQTVNELLNSDKNLEYFSLGVTTTEYFKYVNTLTRNSAILMEIGDMKLHSKKLSSLDWGQYNADIDTKSQLSQVLGIDGGVSFAFDPQSGISDTLTNTSTDSSIASQINQYSSQVRELEFLAGATAASSMLEGLQSSISSIVGGVSGGTTEDTGDNLFSRIGTGINNVVQGLNLKFPEIWADSQQQKSYSCEMKFVSPYASLFCCWRYVLVPFFHLLPLAAPRATKSLNSYTSPFIIRAYSKGYFNVEMGIIDSLTYKRFGDGDMITADGIPMQMDCEVAFHDLYKQLTVCTAGGTNAALFFNNTGLIDLLGTLSGVNMCRLNLEDRASMFLINSYNSVMDVKTNFRRRISDKFNTFLAKFTSTY